MTEQQLFNAIHQATSRGDKYTEYFDGKPSEEILQGIAQTGGDYKVEIDEENDRFRVFIDITINSCGE